MKQTLYLIRHGNTTGTEAGLLYGATDLPVTDAGIAEIADMAAAGVYPDPEGAAMYTSGMLRTEQTFRAIYGDAEHTAAPLLREIDLGPYEMKSVREVMKDDFGRRWLRNELKPEELKFSGGDSDAGFRDRTHRGISEIIEREMSRGTDRIIAVIHGAVITYLMDGFFPGTFLDKWDWTPVPGSGYMLRLEDGIPVSWGALDDPETW